MRIYFDHNASAPLLPAARQAMLEALALTGNASSTHSEGRLLRSMVEGARERIACRLGCAPRQIVFTSGATEAAALVLSPRMRMGSETLHFSHLYVSAIEHPCVLAGGRFSDECRSLLPVGSNGVIDLDALRAALAGHDRNRGAALVAVMFANNETGIIQPVAETARIVHEHGAHLLVDAVQAFGRIDFSLADTGADFLILSGHKIGGPQGVGSLVLGNEDIAPEPLLAGGGQEYFRRAGTENVAAIAGFGAAAANQPDPESWREIEAARGFIEAGLVTICRERGLPPPVVFGADQIRLGNTSCFAMAGVAAETALISLDLSGIAASSGSACSSGKIRRSHVLEAMGVSKDLAGCALRISLGPGNDRNDAARFLDAWREIVHRAASVDLREAV